MDLVLRLGHVIEQELQNQGASEASAFDFEVGKAHGQVSVLNVRSAEKARIGHGFGEAIALAAVGCAAHMVGTVLSEVLAADILIAFLSVLTAKPAAFVAQKFHLVLLTFRQGVQFVKGFVQAKIRDNISEIIPVHFVQELPEIRQHLGSRGYKIEVGVMTFQIFQQQIGMDNDAIPSLFVEQGAQTIALFVRKMFLPEKGVAKG